jgi:hypothetical protein
MQEWIIVMMFFWLNRPVDWLVKAKVFEKRAVSNFSSEDGEQQVYPKIWLLLANPHGDLTQKNINRT